MADPINWDALYAEYLAYWSAVLSGSKPATDYEPPAVAVRQMIDPTDDDTRWVMEALRQEGKWPQSRKWFLAALVRHATGLAEAFLRPLLDAAIHEINPSYNRYFVEPCIESFGPRRVNEYLLGVVESGTDFRKAGAINALYWAQVSLAFPAGARCFDIQHATRESRIMYEALQDVWDRKRRLLLETFVASSSVDVRRSIIASLDLDPQDYPDTHRALVAQAIEVARSHEDDYIRHRLEVQLGNNTGGLAPLPHRDKGGPAA